MIELNREELAWAAGFFDGEGCTTRGLDRRNGNRPTRLSISNTNIACLQRFRSAVGSLGAICDQGRAARPGYKPMYAFYTSSFTNTQAIIAMLWPWLGQEKRAQAAKALSGYVQDVRNRKPRTVLLTRTCKRGHCLRQGRGRRPYCRECTYMTREAKLVQS